MEKLTRRGSHLLDRLPGSLSAELLGIVAQSETILAKNLKALLIDALVDATKRGAECEKSEGSGPGDHNGTGPVSSTDEAIEQMLQELIKMAGDVFERLPSEHSMGLVQGILQGTTPLATLLRNSSEPAPDAGTADLLKDLIASTTSLFDHIPSDFADEIISHVTQGSTMIELSSTNTVTRNLPAGEAELDYVAAISDIVEKMMALIEARLASDPMSLVALELEPSELSHYDCDVRRSTEKSEDFSDLMGVQPCSHEGRDLVEVQGTIDGKNDSIEVQNIPLPEVCTVKVSKIDIVIGPNTPRTPLSSIPEDVPISVSVWSPQASSVPQSLSTILAVLKFNDLDIATGYDVFDYDQDGRISLRDLRRKCQELSLEMSAEAVVALFQALVDARTGHVSRDVWAESLANGDADSVLAKRGVAPQHIPLSHVVQDVMKDMIGIVVQHFVHEEGVREGPDYSKHVSFSEKLSSRRDTAMDACTAEVLSSEQLCPTEVAFGSGSTSTRQSPMHPAFKTIRNGPSGILHEDLSFENLTSGMPSDSVHPAPVTDDFQASSLITKEHQDAPIVTDEAILVASSQKFQIAESMVRNHTSFDFFSFMSMCCVISATDFVSMDT